MKRDSRGAKGRAATTRCLPGDYALSIGLPRDMATPLGWRWAPLAELATLESGHTPSREHPEYWGGDIPWVGLRDAKRHHGGVIDTTLECINQLGIDNSSARLLPKGTVCLSRTASVGYAVVLNESMATSQDFVNWACDKELDPFYLLLVFMSEQRALRRFSIGATHQTIYFPQVKAFHILLPPIGVQRQLVQKVKEIRSATEMAQELLTKKVLLLDELFQSVRERAVSGKLETPLSVESSKPAA